MAHKFSFSLNDEELKIWTAFAEYRGLSLDYLVETVVPKLYTRFMLLIMTNPDEVVKWILPHSYEVLKPFIPGTDFRLGVRTVQDLACQSTEPEFKEVMQLMDKLKTEDNLFGRMLEARTDKKE